MSDEQVAEAIERTLETTPKIATGAVIGKCHKRHCATEFLDFLKQIATSVPEDQDVHIVVGSEADQETAAALFPAERHAQDAKD